MSDQTGKTLGRYRILERIGRGGMAEVYKAYQPSLDRYVAVKVLHPFLLDEPGSRERFQNEARAVAALRHPHIVQVFDFDTEGDLYFMVMEFIDGPNLKSVLQEQAARGTRLNLRRIEEIITAIGGALGYAHQQGMIHRDVKPHNIMFTAAGQPLLTDFGIAKIISGGSNISVSGALSGTPAYMSPEQGRGAALDARTDIYSLGVVLYEMATGQVPFDADTPFAVVIKHINDPLPLPHTLSKDVPEALERVILKAMAKLPDERFQTAAEMVAATYQASSAAPPVAAEQPPAPASAPSPAGGAAIALPPPTSPPAPPSTGGLSPMPPAAPAPPVAGPPRARALAALSGGRAVGLIVLGALIVLVLLVGAGLRQGGSGPGATSTPAGSPTPAPAALSTATGSTAALVLPTTTVDITAYPDTATAIQDGNSLLADKKYEQAVRAYRVALAHDPQNAAAWLGLGQALLGLERYADAREAFTTALAARPDDLLAQLGRAQAYAELGNWSDALTDANRVLAQDKNNLIALLVHASASAHTGDWPTADADYKAALAAHPNDPQIYQARGEAYLDQSDKVAEARADFQQALTLDPNNSTLWTDLGRAYIQYQDNVPYEQDRAIEALGHALLLDPQNGDAYYLRGMIYLDHKNDAEHALADLTRAIEIGPATANLYHDRARCYQLLNNDKDQLADLDRTVALEPQNPVGYYWRYVFYLVHRDYAHALADLTARIQLVTSEEDLAAYAQRSEIYLLLEDFTRAEADARHIITANPNLAEGYQALAHLFFVQQNYPAALEQADKAVASTGHKYTSADDARALRGWVHLLADVPSEAAADFEAVLQASSYHRIALLGRAALALAKKDYDAALPDIQVGIGQNDAYGLGYLLRARLELAQNDQLQARNDVQAAQQRILFPDEQAVAATLLKQLNP